MNNSPQRRVYAFGSFDGLHPGHRFFLKQAQRLGDHLTVVIARDVNIERSKKHLPLFSEQQRLESVLKLGLADEVRLGGSGKPLDLLKTLSVDVICLGYDQAPGPEVLKKYCAQEGLSIEIVRAKPLFPIFFKSSFLKKIGAIKSRDVEKS